MLFFLLLLFLMVLLLSMGFRKLKPSDGSGSVVSSTGGGSFVLATNTPALPTAEVFVPTPTALVIVDPTARIPTSTPAPTEESVISSAPIVTATRPSARRFLPEGSPDACQGVAIGPLQEMEAAVAGVFPMSQLTMRTSQIPQRSISDLARDHELQLSDLSKAALQFQDAMMAYFVKAGWMSQAAVASIDQDTATQLEAAFSSPMPQGFSQARQIADRRHILDIAASALGMDYFALKEQRSRGGTIFDLAKAKGVDPVARILNPALDSEGRYIAGVVARSRMSPDEEATIMGVLEERFSQCILDPYTGS